LEPGGTPHENAQFLLFLTALIKAVDDYQELLRVSVAGAGNDQRLGAHEAPPTVVSMFLGDELTEILEALESGSDYMCREIKQMEIGVTALPNFPKDTTDRNRTSPFAFTGNKFEFRMPGSMFSIAEPNIVLNTVVADVLRGFADSLESSSDFHSDLASLIKNTFHEHKRIVFNGNNYSGEWLAEAAKRGLSNLNTTVEALPEYLSSKSIGLFERHGVFSEKELRSRYEILMEGYCKTVHIEALTMADIVKRMIIPACVDYQNDLASLLNGKKPFGIFDSTLEESLLSEISSLSADLPRNMKSLEDAIKKSDGRSDLRERAKSYRENVYEAMSDLRRTVDGLETLVADKHWPLPTYAEMLYSV
jgi:glutamine synthetase